MTRRPYVTLVIILLLVAFAIWVDVSKQITIVNPFNNTTLISANTDIRLGLDLRGRAAHREHRHPLRDHPLRFEPEHGHVHARLPPAEQHRVP